MMAFWPRFEPSPGLVAEWHLSLPDLVCPGFRLREPSLEDAERLAAAFGPEAASRLGIAAPGARDWLGHPAAEATDRRLDMTARLAGVTAPAGDPDVESFVLFRPFVPFSTNDQRTELQAYMMASSSPESYGELTTYIVEETNGRLPDGPLRVARIVSSDFVPVMDGFQVKPWFS